MASRKGNPVHGWVILDKPEGLSSSKAVGIVRRVFTAAKAGHGGTLDPLATGILPIALGEATKTVSFALQGAKSYEFTLRFGAQTSTDDREGEVIAMSTCAPTPIPLPSARFTGDIDQRPPTFRHQVDGQRAYDIARKAVADRLDSLPELESRQVRIDALSLRDASPDEARFFVACGRAPIQSLARDLATALGGVGHVSRLRRLSVGPFAEKDAISLDFLEKLEHSAAAFEHLKPVTGALDDIPALHVGRRRQAPSWPDTSGAQPCG